MSRKNISQPDEWWLAFQTEADKHGQSLSEWMGDCCRSNLPKSVAAQLPDRPAAHRPKGTTNDKARQPRCCVLAPVN